MNFPKIDKNNSLLIGLFLLFSSGYLSSFSPWGACSYYSFQINVLYNFSSLIIFFILFYFIYYIYNILNLSENFRFLTKIIIVSFIIYMALKSIYFIFNYADIDIEKIDQEYFQLDFFNLNSYYTFFSILLFSFLVVYYNKLNQIIRFFSILGYCLFLLIVYQFSTNFDCIRNFVPKNNVEFFGKLDRQVIWIVFDEFDPELYFKNNTIGNFSKLKEVAVFNQKMMPPGMNTITSVPASLMGQGVTKRYKFSSDGKLIFKNTVGNNFEFGYEGSVFDNLKHAGYDSSIFGFYHPYCRLFPDTDCITYSDTPKSWYGGVTRYVAKFINKILPTSSFIPIEWSGDIAAQQINDLNNFIATKKQNLLYLHLMLPHLPARYAQSYYHTRVESDLQAYFLNLKLSDEVLGNILSSIPNDGRERLLIIDSDHWYRDRDRANPHPSLSIVKVLSDSTSFINDKPTSRIYTPSLIINFLNGKIKSNADVLDFYSNKTYHDTYMPTSK